MLNIPSGKVSLEEMCYKVAGDSLLLVVFMMDMDKAPRHISMRADILFAPVIFSLPFKSLSSITTKASSTLAPQFSTNFTAAAIVPPVASRSSTYERGHDLNFHCQFETIIETHNDNSLDVLLFERNFLYLDRRGTVLKIVGRAKAVSWELSCKNHLKNRNVISAAIIDEDPSNLWYLFSWI